jgi:4-oxalocrotonate tautomerase
MNLQWGWAWALELIFHTFNKIYVPLFCGRTQREKDRLAEAITDNVVNILKVERNDVVIVFQDTPHGNWYASGIRL